MSHLNAINLLNNLQGFVVPKDRTVERDREHRVEKKAVGPKLKKAWDLAQKQKALECDNPHFQFRFYNSFQAPRSCHAQSLQVGKYQVGVCHAQGGRPTQEDQHLSTSFSLRLPGGKVYPVELFGIFDGHGGSEAALYMTKYLQVELTRMLQQFHPDGNLTDQGIWNALKLTFVHLSDRFKKLDPNSGTTATVVLMLDGTLWTANVGDSRTILVDSSSGTAQLSEDAKPSDPRYQKGIEKRGGVIDFNQIPPRINGSLAVARAIGDANVGPGVSSRPKITKMLLSQIHSGSHLVLTCDGIYDVASTRQVGRAVRVQGALKKNPLSIARDLVFSAYRAGSEDNLSALVVCIP
jgi:protein phosphatase 1L